MKAATDKAPAINLILNEKPVTVERFNTAMNEAVNKDGDAIQNVGQALLSLFGGKSWNVKWKVKARGNIVSSVVIKFEMK